jgi:N-acetylglucosaminyldiphosphoundecaprenol N-acetyl-beta-D-mannosaminyltransferase
MPLQSNLTSATNESVRSEPHSFRVLGVPVHAVQIPEVVDRMENWIRCNSRGKYVAVTGMHGIAESRKDGEFRQALESADLVVPDGMPLVWLGRWHRHGLKRRVYGPELMETFCRETGSAYRHYFYGGAEGTADRLANSLQKRYGIVIAGTHTPPFRALTPQEKSEVGAQIDAAAPDLLWIGLSTPKQEKWMYQNREQLSVPVMLGVGAAFDVNSGLTQQAPVWMRENGLEWLFRLLTEPKRLWRRYLVTIPKAAGLVLMELAGVLPRA